MLEWTGMLIGVISLVVTGVIYKRQSDDQTKFEELTRTLHKDQVARIDSSSAVVKEIAKMVAADRTDQNDEPVVAPDELPVGHEIVPNVDRYLREEIPLKVLSDLVIGWNQLDDGLDRSGWSLGDVAFALHKREGKGNHPWFVVLRATDDPANIRLWRVTRGGAGRTGPTVTPWDAVTV